MAAMEDIRLIWKNDDMGQPMHTRLCWSSAKKVVPKPIALVFHAGGFMIGSANMIPKPQIQYLCEQGFLVVIPNHRLCPQVPADVIFVESKEVYDWATEVLPGIMEKEHGLSIDPSKVVAMGHSAGGTLALHLAASKPIKAATALYPSLYASDPTTSSHKPSSAPPFGLMPDYEPTEEELATIFPTTHQISEFALAAPGAPPLPRNRYMMNLIKHGEWLKVACPNGNYAMIDPMTRLSKHWAPVMFVQGDKDTAPGSGLDLVQRAEKDMRAAGVKEVKVEIVPGEAHMFDLPPTVGTSDLGPKWEALKKGMDFLISHV